MDQTRPNTRVTADRDDPQLLPFAPSRASWDREHAYIRDNLPLKRDGIERRAGAVSLILAGGYDLPRCRATLTLSKSTDQRSIWNQHGCLLLSPRLGL